MVETSATGRGFPGFGSVAEDIIPDVDDTYDLGSADKRWALLYVVMALLGSLVIGGTVALTTGTFGLIINDSTQIQGDLLIDNNLSAINITSTGFYFGDGSKLSGVMGNNTDGWWINFSRFQADTYLTDSGTFRFNFYDDGSEFYFNLTSIGDAINFITDNSKMVLYNSPSAGNNWKVFQVFSKEAQDTTEFVISKAKDELTSYFVRSLSLVGNGTAIPNPWNCTTFANYIDCKTDVTGPDFYVLDDVEINGSLYVGDGNFRVNDDGDITLTDQNITGINCIIFDSGGKICSGV